jgi:hypothetical protein
MREYLLVSAVVFGVYTFFHLLRVLLAWPASVGEWTIPVWLSGGGLALNGALSFWALRLVRRSRQSA